MCAFFPSFISTRSIVSTNFRANLDAQNAGNGISVLQMMVKFSFTFCEFYPLFISNTSIVSINFGENLDAQNAGNDISGNQISKIFWGTTPPDRPPPIHAWYIGHTRGLQPLLSPSNILSHRKVPFQKMPPHGKILKKGPDMLYAICYMLYAICYML